MPQPVTCNMQERPGLVVLTIELEGALAQMPGNLSPSRMWSPYREPLAKFLNKYSVDVSTASVQAASVYSGLHCNAQLPGLCFLSILYRNGWEGYHIIPWDGHCGHL